MVGREEGRESHGFVFVYSTPIVRLLIQLTDPSLLIPLRCKDTFVKIPISSSLVTIVDPLVKQFKYIFNRASLAALNICRRIKLVEICCVQTINGNYLF